MSAAVASAPPRSPWGWIVGMPFAVLFALGACFVAASFTYESLQQPSPYAKSSPLVRVYAEMFLRPHWAASSSAGAICVAAGVFLLRAARRRSGRALFAYCVWAFLHLLWIGGVVWIDTSKSLKIAEDPGRTVVFLLSGLAPAMLLVPLIATPICWSAMRRSRLAAVAVVGLAIVIGWVGWRWYRWIDDFRRFRTEVADICRPLEMPPSLSPFVAIPFVGMAWGAQGVQVNDKFRLNDDDLAGFRTLPSAKHLLILGSRFTDRGMDHLRHLKGLESITLQGNGFTGRALDRLDDLSKVTSLYLWGKGFADDGIASRKDLVSLRWLGLAGTNVTDRTLESLAGKSPMERLDVSRTRITPAGLKRFIASQPRPLYSLSVDAAQLDEGVVDELIRTGSPGSLSVVATENRKPPANLVRNTNIAALWLFGESIGDEWLKMVANTPTIFSLQLETAPVDDRQIPLLIQCKSLRFLSVNPQKMTYEGRQALQKAMPGVEISPKH